ncbi:hypothetical protein R1sor_025007 [Riccia sorocarpa]|uniref:Glucan endo-1,3-beta-D-glucosidase n=1 Tax=Riccia sorocarpa TaxID=122646 RepID=A0ABD3G9C1_9MARC
MGGRVSLFCTWILLVLISARWLTTSSAKKCICGPCLPGPGICFGEEANNIRGPTEIVQFLQRQKLKSIRLYSTHAPIMKAFQGKKIDLIVGISNADLKLTGIAWNYAAAELWVKTNILPYASAITPIKAIVVGNEVTSVGDWDLVSQTEPAMRNIYKALKKAGLDDKIKVSTPFGQDILEVTWPPSDGQFRVQYAWNIVKPVLDFLSETGSPLMINLYTFSSYKNDPQDVNLDAALLNAWGPISVDYKTGHVYKNLLSQLIDSAYAAAEKMGHPNITLVLSETGWPSSGHEAASLEHAAMYSQNLVNLIVGGGGTPLRPDLPIQAYIYSLFNENMRKGDDDKRNFGIFKPNFVPVYDIEWNGEDIICFPHQKVSSSLDLASS